MNKKYFHDSYVKRNLNLRWWLTIS